MKLHTFHPGGVHLPDSKLSAGKPIVDVGLPHKVVITMSQHQGAPARPVVSVGDEVKRFQLVGEAQGFISANIHSPITGVVKAVGPVVGSYGYDVEAVTVEASEEQHEADVEMPRVRVRDDAAIAAMSPDDIIAVSKDFGLVGMGGATFPTYVKLKVPEGRHADVMIVNAAECEPYLTSDHALMLAEPEAVVRGVEIARKACGAPEAVIAVEANKPDAIELLSRHIPAGIHVRVMALKERYPQGGEKQLINAVTGRQVPNGKLPIDAGAVVINVGTVYALWRAVAYSEPLVERIVTVTGPAMERCGNFRAVTGTPISTLLGLTDAYLEQGSKLVLGGPMMGRAALNPDAPVEKGTSGLLVLPPDMARRAEPEACVRCAKCVSVCPMGLEPYLISTLSRLRRIDDAAGENIMACIECGSCSYVCPSSRPILDFIRLGKGLLRSRKKK